MSVISTGHYIVHYKTWIDSEVALILKRKLKIDKLSTKQFSAASIVLFVTENLYDTPV